MSKLTGDSGIDKITDDKDKWRFISTFFDQLKSIINNGLQFVDNFNGKSLTVVFSAANTDTTVAHGLGRAPAGYIITSLSANMVIYNGSAASNSSNLVLRSSAAGSAAMIVY